MSLAYLQRLIAVSKERNLIQEHNVKKTYFGRNVGLYSTESKSYLQIPDNGDIKLSTDKNTGLFIDKEEQSIMLASERANITSQYVSINTSPYGFDINRFVLNPMLYTLSDVKMRLKGEIRVWIEETEEEPGHWAYRSIRVRPFYAPGDLERMGLKK